MRVLITGGAGFLGSHLGDSFLARGDEVTALDVAPDAKVRHNLENPCFRYVQGSVFDQALLDTLIGEADLVYHLAAVVGVEHYVGDPLHVLNVNVNGTQNVLRAAHRFEKRVVFASTSEVYGKSDALPFREDGDRVLGSTHVDRWCYSTSKATGEHLCFAYGRLGLPVTILRYFNVYGPRLDAIDLGRVITIFMGQLLRGEPLTVIGDGSQTRCFTYVSDAVRATARAGLLPEAIGGVFNVGTDRETTILELAETMLRLRPTGAGVSLVPPRQVYGELYEDIPRRIPDTTRLRQVLGVQPEVCLEEGLARTIEWFARERLVAPV